MLTGAQFGCSPSPVKDWNTLQITLERSTCFGTCPAYSVSIRGDGSVVYDGKLFVVSKGRRTRKISEARVRALVDEFQRADFFSLRDYYVARITDVPAYLVSIVYDGRKKSVADMAGEAAGMPRAVSSLEDLIDKTAETAEWIGHTRRP